VLYYNFFYCLPHAGGSTSAIVNKIKQGFRKDSNQIQQAKQWRAIYKAYLFIIFYFTDLISHNGKKKKNLFSSKNALLSFSPAFTLWYTTQIGPNFFFTDKTILYIEIPRSKSPLNHSFFVQTTKDSNPCEA